MELPYHFIDSLCFGAAAVVATCAFHVLFTFLFLSFLSSSSVYNASTSCKWFSPTSFWSHWKWCVVLFVSPTQTLVEMHQHRQIYTFEGKMGFNVGKYKVSKIKLSARTTVEYYVHMYISLFQTSVAGDCNYTWITVQILLPIYCMAKDTGAHTLWTWTCSKDTHFI